MILRYLGMSHILIEKKNGWLLFILYDLNYMFAIGFAVSRNSPSSLSSIMMLGIYQVAEWDGISIP